MDYLTVISISQVFFFKKKREKERKSFENFTHRIFFLISLMYLEWKDYISAF